VRRVGRSGCGEGVNDDRRLASLELIDRADPGDFLTFWIVSEIRRGLRPKRMPRSRAFLMPSICRSRRMSFSNSAISARVPIISFPVREVVSMGRVLHHLERHALVGKLRDDAVEVGG
jgi:hypothetical protein